MATQENPHADVPMSLHMYELGYTREFKTYPEIAQWAQSEITAWQALERIKLRRNASLRQAVISGQQSFWQRLQSQAAAAENQPQHRANVMNFMTEVAQGMWVISDSTLGIKILDKIDDDPKVALGCLMYQMNNVHFALNQADDIPELMEITVGALLDERSGVGDVKAEKAALAGLKKRWEGKLSQFWKKQLLEEADRSQSFSQGKKLARKLLFNLKNGTWDHARRTSEIAADHDKQMATMRQAFSTDMKLRASEKFWGAKRKIHAGRAGKAFHWFGGTSIGAIIFLPLIYLGIDSALGKQTGLNTAHVFYFGLPTLLWLWIIKLFAGQFLANRNLESDAEERMAMVHTFKALEYEERVSEEERLVVLHALFRPHESKSDNSLPSPIWDAIFKNLDKK